MKSVKRGNLEDDSYDRQSNWIDIEGIQSLTNEMSS